MAVKKNDAALIEDEVEAIDGYDDAIENETNPERKDTLEHIRDEEKEHIEEIADMDKDKDISADEAWNDFKSSYDKEEFDEAHKDDVTAEGDTSAVVESAKKGKSIMGKTSKRTMKSTDAANDTTLDGKLDTIASMVNELDTDVERTLDVIPEVKGEVAGGEALGEENEDELFGDDIFGDDTEGEVDEEGNPVEGEEGEGNPFAEGEESAEGEEAEGEVDENGEPIEDEAAEDGEGVKSADEIIEEDSEEAEPDAEAEAEDEEEASDEDEELMEKMVHIISKQAKEIKALKSRMDAMEKMQKNMTVQKPTSATKKAIRHHPIYKSVGVVSKPPVQNGFNSRFSTADGTNDEVSFSDPKALVKSYKQKGIL